MERIGNGCDLMVTQSGNCTYTLLRTGHDYSQVTSIDIKFIPKWSIDKMHVFLWLSDNIHEFLSSLIFTFFAKKKVQIDFVQFNEE